MVISKDKRIKENFSVVFGGKQLVHQKHLIVLGNTITEDLNWDRHVDTNVIPQLANRARSLKLISNLMEPKLKKMYATAIFMGKLQFAIDAWAGVGLSQISRVQKIQDRVAKQTLGHKWSKASKSQRLNELGWLPVKQEAKLATLRLAHKITTRGIPEEMSAKMPLCSTTPRLREARKLAMKPKYLNKNKKVLSSFRNRAYTLNTLPHRLTEISDPKTFNKWVKVYLRNPAKLPKVIPKREAARPRPNQTTDGRRSVKKGQGRPEVNTDQRARQSPQHQPNQTQSSRQPAVRALVSLSHYPLVPLSISPLVSFPYIHVTFSPCPLVPLVSFNFILVPFSL